MKKSALILGICLTTLTACQPPEPPTIEEVMVQCGERARKAASPDVNMGISVNSRGRVSTGIGIRVSGDQLAGRDPNEVYESCVVARTGQLPPEPLSAVLR